MSVDKLVDSTQLDSDLTSVANAIRTKGGTSAQLTFPSGFVSAVQNIPSGANLQSKTNINPTTSSQTIQPDSGYDGLSSVQINAMPTGTAGTPTATKGAVSNHSVSVTPSVTNTTGYIEGSTKTGTPVTVSASELVSGTKSITENGTGIDVTEYASVDVNVSGGGGSSEIVKLLDRTITEISNSEVTSLGKGALQKCTSLSSVNFPNVTTIAQSAFAECSSLGVIHLDSLVNFTGNNVFESSGITGFVAPSFTGDWPYASTFLNCSKLVYADIYGPYRLGGGNAFSNCTSLNVIVLRKSNTIVNLDNINAVNNTLFASGKAGGTLYVPQSLISFYQSASNWSTILGYANNQIKAIEGSIYENAYADGTPIS